MTKQVEKEVEALRRISRYEGQFAAPTRNLYYNVGSRIWVYLSTPPKFTIGKFGLEFPPGQEIIGCMKRGVALYRLSFDWVPGALEAYHDQKQPGKVKLKLDLIKHSRVIILKLSR